MVNIFGVIGLGYLAGSGLVTGAGMVGRGLVRAARAAASGRMGEAGTEALAALAAPAVLAFTATAGLVTEALDGATNLAGPVLSKENTQRPRSEAA